MPVNSPMPPGSSYNPGPPNPNPAPMGYVGLIKVFGTVIRATSSSLNIKQTVEPEKVIDGTVDQSVYRLSAVTADGTVEFPVIMDPTVPIADGTPITPTTSAPFLDKIWSYAVHRHQFIRNGTQAGSAELGWMGEVIQDTAYIRYFYGASYRYNTVKVNKMTLNFKQGEAVTGSLELWATTRDPLPGEEAQFAFGSSYLSPARVMMWPEVQLIAGYSDGGTGTDIPTGSTPDPSGFRTYDGSVVRSYSIDIDNALARNYTFDPQAGYYPQNISTGKRTIGGSLEFQGWAPTERLADVQHSSGPSGRGGPGVAELDTLSKQVIRMTVNTGAGYATPWVRVLMGVIYEHQTANSTMEVFTSTVNYKAFGLKSKDFQAVTATNDPSLSP
jgi:hypothetical protein